MEMHKIRQWLNNRASVSLREPDDPKPDREVDVNTGVLRQSRLHIPMELAIKQRRGINPEEDNWRFVLEATGQPAIMI